MEEQLRKIIHFNDYLRVIQKRKWLAITFFSLLLIAGSIKSYTRVPVYRATTKILMERENPKITDIQDVLLSGTQYLDYYKTQYEILQSRSLALEVITKLKLWESPEFTPEATPTVVERIRGEINDSKNRLVSSVKGLVKKAIGVKEKVQEEKLPKGMNTEPNKDNVLKTQPIPSYLINAYLGKLVVTPVEETRLVDIGFEGRYPKLITQIINTHAKTYIEQNLKRKFDANQLAVNWLGRGLEELKEKEVKAEKALQQFKEKEDIISLDSIMFSEKSQGDNIIVQKISQLNNNLTTAKLKRIELGAVYEQLKQIMSNPEEVEAFPDIMQDPLIRSYKQEYANLTRQYLELSERYGEKHPKIISLKLEMEEKKSNITAEAEKLAKSMETQYRTAKDNEEKVERTLNEYRQEALFLNRKALEYDILKREVDTNRDLYEYFLKRLKETNITSGNTASNISIVDPAEVPSFPLRTNRQKFILLSVIVGLTVGIGLTFLFEYLDNTVKSPYDVEMYLRRLPFLGPIGSFSTLESELITFIKPESNFSESFRNLRTNLLLNASNNGYKTFLITSPDRGEGKTLVSANLAITMTQNRKKVLLIDANMRMPRLYSLFGVENSLGLSDFLNGEATLETITKPTDVDGVFIITAGKIPLDPLELLSSESMASLVEKMRERFDSIVIDAPGISVGPDATVISRLVDGVIMVTQFAKTPRTLAQQAIDQFTNIQAKLLGVVINNIDYKRGRYHFPYYGLLLKDDSRIDMYMVERVTF